MCCGGVWLWVGDPVREVLAHTGALSCRDTTGIFALRGDVFSRATTPGCLSCPTEGFPHISTRFSFQIRLPTVGINSNMAVCREHSSPKFFLAGVLPRGLKHTPGADIKGESGRTCTFEAKPSRCGSWQFRVGQQLSVMIIYTGRGNLSHFGPKPPSDPT